MLYITLKRRKQRLREEKPLTQRHPMKKLVSRDLKLALPESKAPFASLGCFSYLKNEWSTSLLTLPQHTVCFKVFRLFMMLIAT